MGDIPHSHVTGKSLNSMLTLNNVNIHIQNFGTRYGIFLVSKDKKAIEERYYSFFNHGGTSGELEWWADNTALLWIFGTTKITVDDKFRWTLAQMALFTILNKGHTKGRDAWIEACDLAYDWYDKIEYVNWLSFDVHVDLYGLGDSVHAEKDTGNFNCDVISKTLTRNGASNLDGAKNLDDLSDEEPVENENAIA